MDLHLFEFFGSQASWLGNDVFGNGQLADIVKQGGGLQSIELFLADAHLLADLGRINAHPLQVGGGGSVLGFDRERERLDRPQMQTGDFFDVGLVGFKPVQRHPVRPVDKIDERKQHERRLPCDLATENNDQPCRRTSRKVVGKNPEIGAIPGRTKRFAAHQRQEACDKHTVDGNVCRSCQPQKQGILRAHDSGKRPVEDSMRSHRGEAGRTRTEGDMDRFGRGPRTPEALHDGPRDSQKDRFRTVEQHDPDENRKEIDRKCSEDRR